NRRIQNPRNSQKTIVCFASPMALRSQDMTCSAFPYILEVLKEALPVKRTLAVICFAICTTFGLAQSAATAAPATTKDPVANSVRFLLQRSQDRTVGALESMPADKYSYKPTPDQMTFAHLAAHIAESNYLFCSKAADIPAPKTDEAKDTDPKDKLVAAVKASY